MATTLCKWKKHIIRVGLFFFFLPAPKHNLQGCFTSRAEQEHVPDVSLSWSANPLEPCIIHSAAGLMGQLINGRLVSHRDQLITHLQQGPTQSSTDQNHNRQNDYRLQRSRRPPPTSNCSCDSATLTGLGAAAGAEGKFNRTGAETQVQNPITAPGAGSEGDNYSSTRALGETALSC